MKHLVIIGNGIAGITCARHVRKLSDCRITVISAESDHFYSRTALMYIYMGHMKYEHTKPYEDWFWPKNRIELLRAYVSTVNTHSKELTLADGRKIAYDSLVLATGSVPNAAGWPGENLRGVQGLYSLQDLENMERDTRGVQRGVIVGGGLIGIEMAEMLLSRHIPVTMLVRENDYWNAVLPTEEARMISREIRHHGVDLRLSTELAEIRGDAEGRVQAVITKSGETIDCQFVGLTIGVKPNIRFLENSGIETDRGILVDEYFRTSVPDVYAIGDCAQYRTPIMGRKPVEQVWYTGRMHGETLAKTLGGKQTAYNPGLWFNSAKFFNIEYQVYGTVPNGAVDGLDSLYWEHPEGKKSVRIVYRSDNRQVVGFNLMGIRYRQEICERWINDRRDLDYVMHHLPKANFDPEFYRRHEKDIQQAYYAKIPREDRRKGGVLAGCLGL